MFNHLKKYIESDQFDKVSAAAAFSFGILGIIYLFSKSIFADWQDIDFLHIWLAGHAWAEGISPYSKEYIELGNLIFDPSNPQPDYYPFNGQAFFYPPGMWFLSRFFAFFEYNTAVEIWRWFSVFMIFASSLILKEGLAKINVKISWPTIVFYTGLVSIMQSTVLTFVLGQTSILIYLGVCIVIFSVLSRNNFLLALGLFIVLLKPNVGAGLFIALIPFGQYRKALFITCILTFLMYIPPTIQFGMIKSIQAYISGTMGHGDFIANHPELTTGIRNILFHVTDIEIASSIALLITVLVIWTALTLCKKSGLNLEGEKAAEMKLFLLTVTLSMIACLAPLHTYDLIFIAPVILLSQKFDKASKAALFVSFLIIARSQNISLTTGIFYPPYPNLWSGGEIATLAALFNAVLIFTVLKRYLRKNNYRP
ncbi:MAG: hypothetical protein JKY84_09370 [Emcibacteraceae bacterium]|nr:hypothetical protein [Emcibacteraceae bacterium]